jgi:pimeloyl-ACP methyl ester carboxylesterase
MNFRRLRMPVRAACLLMALLLLGGCAAPLTIQQLSPQASYDQLNRSALSSNRLSEYTLTVLRRHGLLDTWRQDPAAGIAALRKQVVASPDLWHQLFALAELSYLRGRRDGSRPDALAAAIYAWAFLFPEHSVDRPSPFDPRFRQACDIYNLGLTAAFTPAGGGPVRLASGSYAVPFGTVDIEFNPDQLRWGDRTLVSFEPTSTMKVRGMQSIFRDPGLGAPLAAMTQGGVRQSQGLEVAPRLRVPTNALLVIPAPRRQVAQPIVRADLLVHTIFEGDDVRVGTQVVPLQYDQTVARALGLAESSVWSTEFQGFLNGRLFEQAPSRLVALEPHQPGRMPVILVHGTASSPFRWADMVNDLLEDPAIRGHFEFWLFSYASGNPIPLSALRLRQSIQAAVVQLGGTRADPALGRMTVIGHSQGGLLAKMLVIDPGDRLWNRISRVPLDKLHLTERSRTLLRETLFFQPLPEVQRVIFIATPHRGSYVAALSLSRLVARLVSLPLDVSQVATDVVGGNGSNVLIDPTRSRLGSVYGMSPNSSFIKALAAIPIVPAVHVHSIIAVRTLGRPLDQATDGVVRYSSAHLADAESELIVHSGHSVQSNPATIAEVRRILLLQLATASAPHPAPVAMSLAR